MSKPSVWIEHDQGRLNIPNLWEGDEDRLREVMDAGGVLYWWNDGAVGKVPNSILRDAFEALADERRLLERRPYAHRTADAGVIYWEQTTTPRELSIAAGDPPLRLRHQG